jgi:hypothetical protein
MKVGGFDSSFEATFDEGKVTLHALFASSIAQE